MTDRQDEFKTVQNWILLNSQNRIHQQVLKIRLVTLMIELHRHLAILKRKLEVIESDST